MAIDHSDALGLHAERHSAGRKTARADIGLDPAQWPTVWFKGGDQPGVATLGYLATNSKGQTFVVVAMLSNPAAELPPSALPGLAAIAQAAFQLVR